MRPSVQAIVDLLKAKGSARYGPERVSQLEHALQCAQHAERNGATPELVAACLMHDIGHLLTVDDEHRHGVDAVHQYLSTPYLEPLFPPAVWEPIRLHVDAKRYLCCVDAGYWATLSPASKASLQMQGGAFAPADADNFMRQFYAADAVMLRRWDDLAKVAGAKTASLDYFADVLKACSLR